MSLYLFIYFLLFLDQRFWSATGGAVDVHHQPRVRVSGGRRSISSIARESTRFAFATTTRRADGRTRAPSATVWPRAARNEQRLLNPRPNPTNCYQPNRKESSKHLKVKPLCPLPLRLSLFLCLFPCSFVPSNCYLASNGCLRILIVFMYMYLFEF